MFTSAHAATTIDSVNKHAYAASLGWINAYADGTSGVVIGAYYCTGYLYGANAGWTGLGSGTPASGIRYQNNSDADHGVNNAALATSPAMLRARTSAGSH